MEIMGKLNQQASSFFLADVHKDTYPITFVSENFCKLTGYSLDECLGKEYFFFKGPQTDKDAVEDLQKSVEDGLEYGCKLICHKRDGSTSWTNINVCPVKDKQGNLQMIVGSLEELDENGNILNLPAGDHFDSTEDFAHQLTHKMMMHEKKPAFMNETYINRLTDLQRNEVVCVADARLPDCPIVFANQRFFDLTQYTREEILGRNCRFLQGPDTDRDDVTEIREAIHAGRPVSSCILNYKKDGTLFWNHLHIEPVHDNNGEITFFVASQHDVTHLMDEAIEHICEGKPIDLDKYNEGKRIEEAQDDALQSVIFSLPTADQFGGRQMLKQGFHH